MENNLIIRKKKVANTETNFYLDILKENLSHTFLKDNLLPLADQWTCCLPLCVLYKSQLLPVSCYLKNWNKLKEEALFSRPG